MSGSGTPTPERLGSPNAGELLTLQRAAYVSEAQIYSDPLLPALVQTLDDLRQELTGGVAWGIRENRRLVAAIRSRVDGDLVHIGRITVAPDRQGLGFGTALLRHAESSSGAGRSELFTGHLSVANLRLYEREGYAEVRRERMSDAVELVYLQKSLRRTPEALARSALSPTRR